MHPTRPGGALALLLVCLLACSGIAPPTPTPIPFPTLPVVPTSTLPPTLPPITGGGSGGGGSSAELSVINAVFLPRSDGWRLLGEVVNNSGVTASNIALTLEWFDPAGTRLGSDTAYPLVVNIAPGEAAPFIYNIYLAGVQLGSFTATVAQFTSTESVARARLDVEHALLTVDQFGDFHCTGELVNNTPQPVSIDGLAATVRDRTGVLASADTAWAAARYLLPAERTPYRISPVGFSGTSAADYTCQIVVDGLSAEPLEVGNVTVGSDLLYYVDVFGDSHLVGQITNGSGTAVSATVVAGLYDAGGNVIDADFASPPINVEPGQSLPFDFTTFNAIKFNAELRGQVNGFAVRLDASTVLPAASQLPLVTRNNTAAYQSGALTVTTEVANDQAAPVDYAFMIARVVDASGRLVGYGYITTEPIPPGGAVTASVPVYLDPALDPGTLSALTVAYALGP